MKHAGFLAAAAALALLGVAAPANATHVVPCGTTITQDETLHSDVVCGDTQFVGLYIGASNVTLNLGGHAIRAGTFGGETGVAGAAPTSSPLTEVHIRGGGGGTGSIERFRQGVSLDASNSSAQGLIVTAESGGIEFFGDGNDVLRNTINVTGPGIRGAVHFFGNDAYATRNTVRGLPFVAIASQAPEAAGRPPGTANNPRIVVNSVEGCEAFGILVEGYTSSAVVAKNSVTGCVTGIIATSANPPAPGGAQVRRNISNGNIFAGIVVSDPAAFVWRNTANDNRNSTGASGTGIAFINQPGATVQENTTDNNALYGIDAMEGTIDGGGNTATGNGTNCTPNIQCGP